ncbi:MAG: N-acetyltransferase [Nocardioidaceae bacterium]|nr:N-acetyltransferase [Nocardioidaceae bacterium]MDQ3450252.1 N-acetyltransferase family protein [Actinomycetota bacterium]
MAEDVKPTVQVRTARVDDGAGIAAVYRPYVDASVASFETDPPDAAEMTRRLSAHPSLPWLVAVGSADQLVGFAYAAPYRTRPAYRWSVETSVYVSEPRQGTGRVLMNALLAAVETRGFASAYAAVALPNDASVALHEQLGFAAIGVFPRVGFKYGRWVDVGWWYRPLADRG